MMINDIYTKWKNIISKYTEKMSISAFHVSLSCESRMYFGYDGERKYIFLEFEPYVIENFKCPNVKGLNIEVVDEKHINENFKYIRITNIDNKDEVFLAFCSTLHSEMTSCKTYFDCAEALIKTLKYYKTYFSNPNKPLTEEEEQGLFSELLYLEKLIKLKGDNVIRNWEGPNKNKRDFVFDDKSVEIKSTSSQIAPSIKISNENQLDPSYPENINLFLKVYIVEKVDNGETLIDVAKRIFSSITSIENQKEFLQKLLMNKVDLSLYECINHYSIQKEILYEVNDEFPSITSNKIHPNIFKVEYRIYLNDLILFERSDLNG